MLQNKWQNGFYSQTDRCIYGIPLNADSVLKLQFNDNDNDDSPPTVSTIPLPPHPKGKCLSKWEGGVMVTQGE